MDPSFFMAFLAMDRINDRMTSWNKIVSLIIFQARLRDSKNEFGSKRDVNNHVFQKGTHKNTKGIGIFLENGNKLGS